MSKKKIDWLTIALGTIAGIAICAISKDKGIVGIGSVEEKEFTFEQAKEHLKQQGKKRGKFFFNIFGWQTYLTLNPTFATPTGNNKKFPRSITINVDDERPSKRIIIG